jgi:hypothetical protein
MYPNWGKVGNKYCHDHNIAVIVVVARQAYAGNLCFRLSHSTLLQGGVLLLVVGQRQAHQTLPYPSHMA